MSLRQAINAKCKECIYDPVGGSGHWRQQIEACTATSCPLWVVRPRATKDRSSRPVKTANPAHGTTNSEVTNACG